MEQGTTRAARHWQNGCLLVASLAIGLVFAEWGARYFIEGPGQKVLPKVFVHEKSENPKLLYKPSPNTSSFAYTVENKINRDGFRDQDYPIERREGIKRIVFLGDSVIYGMALREGRTIPDQLELMLQNSGRTVEVLNLGVSGYESEQQIEFFKEVGLKYQPDLVLVGYTLNDSNYASWELDLYDQLVNADVKDPEGNWFQRMLGSLYQRSRVFYLLDRQFKIQKKVKQLRSDHVPIRRYLEQRNRKNQDPPDSPYSRLERHIEEEAKIQGTSEGSLDYLLKGAGFRTDILHSHHWNVSETAFGELKDLAQKHGFQVAVVILPIMQEMDRYPLGPLHEFLQSEFRKLSFHVIDLTNRCREIYAEYGRPTISGDGVHFTEMSALLLAKYLHEQLNELKVIE